MAGRWKNQQLRLINEVAPAARLPEPLRDHLLTNKASAVTPANPRQNQLGIGWCATASPTPPTISAPKSTTQEKPLKPPSRSLFRSPLPRPRRRDLPLPPLPFIFTSICPVSSFVITCSNERGSVSRIRPVSNTWLKISCRVSPAPSASSPRNLRA